MSSSGRLTTLLAVLAPLVAEAAKRTIKKCDPGGSQLHGALRDASSLRTA